MDFGIYSKKTLPPANTSYITPLLTPGREKVFIFLLFKSAVGNAFPTPKFLLTIFSRVYALLFHKFLLNERSSLMSDRRYFM